MYSLLQLILFGTYLSIIEVLINNLNWVADALIKSICMHHNMVNNFENDETSKQLVCNKLNIKFFINVIIKVNDNIFVLFSV